MKILIKAMAGSHLFGTNTPKSDKDYKGVYLPSERELLLGSYKETIQQSTGNDSSKNSQDDVDVELYSLKKFLKMVDKGDTAALELLFTPHEMIIEKDPMWDFILERRDQLLSKQVNAMIGYARQQANKYGIKGSRMGELNNIIKVLKNIEKEIKDYIHNSFPNPKFKHAWLDIVEAVKDFEHVHVITLQTSKNMENEETPALDILGKKFDYHCTFAHVLQILKKIYKNYGQRAREAKNNNGVDWKALSHALRVMFQGQELLKDGYITLPLKLEERDLVMRIKKGDLDYKLVQPIIENNLIELEKAVDNSKLPEKVSKEILDDILLSLHRKVIEGVL